MSKFCRYCGASLEDGQECQCAQAVAERAEVTAPAQTNEIAQPAMQEPVTEASAIEAPTEPTSQTYQVPVQAQPAYLPNQPAQGMPPQGYPQAQPQQPNFQMPSQVSQAAGQVRSSFMNFIKNPLQTISHPETGSAVNGLILVALNALAFAIFTMLFLWKSAGRFPGFQIGFFYPLLTIIVGTACLFGVLLIGGKLLGGKVDPKTMTNIIGISTFPWTVVMLVASVFYLIFGMVSFSVFILSLLFFCAGAFTLLLLEHGLRPQFPNDSARMIILALATAIQWTIGAQFMTSSIVDILLNAAYSGFGW